MADSEATAATHLANGFSRQQLASTITSKIQELILLPTEKCNLRCTYCYEDFTIGRMSESTQAAVERFLDRRVPELSVLRISWFGGEPLLAKDIVLRLSAYAYRLAEQHGVKFSGGLTTNAWFLDRAVLDSLLDCGQNFFQITLDGWGPTHDAVRRFVDGRGSFDRIWSNLCTMQQSERQFDALLRIHVRRENIDDLARLMSELGMQFGTDRRFRLDFEHIRNLGGAGAANIKNPVKLNEMAEIETHLRAIFRENTPGASAELNETRAQIDEALRVAKTAGESAGGQRIEDLGLNQPYICYAAKANSLLIRANGRVGKCTVAFNDDRNDIGSLNPDGTVSINNDKLRPWLRGLTTLEPKELGCPLGGLPHPQSQSQREFESVAKEREAAR